MGSPSLSPATKASLFGVLAVAHVGLLAVMAEPADHAGPRATGGAPVINLTLMPAPRMADRDADQRAAQKLQPLPTSIPASVPMPVIRTSEPPRGPLLEIVRVPSTNPVRWCLVPCPIPRPRPGAEAPGWTRQDSSAGPDRPRAAVLPDSVPPPLRPRIATQRRSSPGLNGTSAIRADGCRALPS